MQTVCPFLPFEKTVNVVSRSHLWVLKNSERLGEVRCSIREFEEDERSDIASMDKEVFGSEDYAYMVTKGNEQDKCYVCVLDPREYGDFDTHHDIILGYIHFIISNSFFCVCKESVTHVYSLCVVPELKRKGIGRKLMDFMELYCASLRCAPKHVTLHTPCFNEGAIQFYTALGYEMCGSSESYYFFVDKYYNGLKFRKRIHSG